MPTKSMLVHSLAALYIFNGIAAGGLGIDETLSHPWRAALQLDNRRDQFCDDPAWAVCPDNNGCCEFISECDYLDGIPVCNVPCGPGSTTCLVDIICCQAGWVCNDINQCVRTTSTANVVLPTFTTTTLPNTDVEISTGKASETLTTTSGASISPTFTNSIPATPIPPITSTTPPVPTSSSPTPKISLQTGVGSATLVTMGSAISFAVIAVVGIFHFSW